MKIYEYRGVEGLVYAPVTEDSAENFTTGTVKQLAGVAEISKTTDSTNEAHYYDNIPAVVVSSTGSDEITINTSAIPLDVLADITGQSYDATTGMFVEQERTPSYFAIGYITKTTDGTEMFVWRLKGTFNMPDQTSATEDDGTDANGQELTFTGITTTHKFTKTGRGAKGITVDTSVNAVDETTFFASVQTPDTVEAASPASEDVDATAVSVSPSTASVAVDGTTTITATLTPSDATSDINWSLSDGTKATFVVDGVNSNTATGSSVTVKGLAAGTTAVVATSASVNDTCVLTVTAGE